MTYEGRAWAVGDNIDTDLIIPARFLVTTSPEELGRHCLSGLDPSFAGKVAPGDILVAGSNFGCGSSREHAPLAIKGCGIACVVAESFARIFFRNAINQGLPVVECGKAKRIREGDVIKVDLDSGLIKNLTRGEEYPIAPYPKFIREILSCGGLIPWARGKEA
ncbi:3-isopropylmalate dehydratase small subunit [Candidatus Bipolaricaulota bacterium]|nr:3-isopropylmalate dehydratase small subunit [Candidatus Bipolaricaulota bacterium]